MPGGHKRNNRAGPQQPPHTHSAGPDFIQRKELPLAKLITHTHTHPTTLISSNIHHIMSGQRSADNEEVLPSAGCALQETRSSSHSSSYASSSSRHPWHAAAAAGGGGITTATTTGITAGTAAAATEDNLLFVWGRGEDGQCGLGDTNDQFEPAFVDALRNVSVLQVAAGSGHTVVL